jgi:hypothetical protein
MTSLNPIQLIREAIRAVPAVRFALGIVGIVSPIAIIFALRIDQRVATFGTIVMVVLMVLLVVFARLVSATPSVFRLPVWVLVWSFLCLSIATALCLFTSVFFRWPVNLQYWIDVRSLTGTTNVPTNDQQIDSLIAILRVRANSIALGLDRVIEAFGSHKAAQPGVKQLADLKQRFLTLHEKHVSAVRARDIHLSHEITGEIHDLLSMMRKLASATYEETSAAYGGIGKAWLDILAVPYSIRLRPGLEPLYDATVSATHSMHYPGEPPSAVPKPLAETIFDPPEQGHKNTAKERWQVQ